MLGIVVRGLAAGGLDAQQERLQPVRREPPDEAAVPRVDIAEHKARIGRADHRRARVAAVHRHPRLRVVRPCVQLVPLDGWQIERETSIFGHGGYRPSLPQGKSTRNHFIHDLNGLNHVHDHVIASRRMKRASQGSRHVNRQNWPANLAHARSTPGDFTIRAPAMESRQDTPHEEAGDALGGHERLGR